MHDATAVKRRERGEELRRDARRPRLRPVQARPTCRHVRAPTVAVLHQRHHQRQLVRPFQEPQRAEYVRVCDCALRRELGVDVVADIRLVDSTLANFDRDAVPRCTVPRMPAGEKKSVQGVIGVCA